MLLKERLMVWLTGLKTMILKADEIDDTVGDVMLDTSGEAVILAAARKVTPLTKAFEYLLATGNVQSTTGLGLMQAAGFSVVAGEISGVRFNFVFSPFDIRMESHRPSPFLPAREDQLLPFPGPFPLRPSRRLLHRNANDGRPETASRSLGLPLPRPHSRRNALRSPQPFGRLLRDRQQILSHRRHQEISQTVRPDSV